MFLGLTTTTNGEFLPEYGIIRHLDNTAMSLANNSPDIIDELRMTSSKFRLNYIFDYVNVDDIVFQIFPSEQRQMISQISYDGSRILGVINTELATAKAKADNTGIRFEEPSEGYIAVLHGLLRKGISNIKILDVLLNKIHNVFTTFLYSTIVRTLDKHFNLVSKSETELACLRYACSYISAVKHFETDVDINEIAVPNTQIQFNRIDPKNYISDKPLDSYKEMANYLNEKQIMPGLDTGTLVEVFIRNLSYRSIVELECGIDLFIDMVLSKSIGHIIPRNLFKLVPPKQLQLITQTCANIFNTSKNDVESKFNPIYQAPQMYETQPMEAEEQQNI